MDQNEASEPDTLRGWIDERVPPQGLGRQSGAVVEALRSQPARASYATAQELAVLAGVNVATVTRTAQSLGYAGWPPLRTEVRARYLAHLSAPEVAEQHRAADASADAALRQDLENLSVLARGGDLEPVARLAHAVAGARRTFVLGDGSYAALATALAHNARIAGYDVEAVVGSGPDIANRLATVGPQDVVVIVSFWRLYESAVTAAGVARARGAAVHVVTDAVSPALARAADEVVLVPAEGSSFFPSLTCGMAVVQAVVARLGTVDPERTRRAVADAETQWRTFELLHREGGRTGRAGRDGRARPGRSS